MASYELTGKVALVTGAARGIGLEVARSLHRRGAAVALLDLDARAAERAAAAIGDGLTIGVGGDVTDPEALGAAVGITVERFGGIDVCTANAGIVGAATTVRAGDPEAFERVLEVNLLGTYRTVRAVLPQLIERRGHLSIVASIYAFFNGVLAAPYGISKAGVEQLGRALRTELRPRGVSVGVAYYGFVATEMVKQGFDADPLAARIEHEQIPPPFRRRISAAHAAEMLVRGIEERSPRVFAPPWLRAYSALRGIVNPLLDWWFERDPRFRALLREADVEGRMAGREIVAARAQDRPPQPETR